MNDVSAFVITFNNSLTIKDCLLSLNNQTFKDFELILVDNNSKDNTKEVIESIKPLLNYTVKAFYLDRNLGFAGGNNFALQYASGKYIALLNPDAIADNFWLEELVNSVESDPMVGICASKMLVYGSDIIDTAGHQFSHLLKGFKRGEGERGFLYNRKEYVFGACGGAVLYRRKMINEIGFLDEDFFLLHEDVDLDFRAQLYGWKVLYVPTALVSHKVRSSIVHMSDNAVYYTLRNVEFVKIKNVPLGIFLRYLPQFIIGMLTEFIYFALKHRRFGLYLKAKMNVLEMLPKMLKKRAVIMKNRNVTNGYLFSIMTPAWQKDFLKTKIKKFIYE